MSTVLSDMTFSLRTTYGRLKNTNHGNAADARHHLDRATAHTARSRVVTFLRRDCPYIAMVILVLFGVALTSISRPGMATYWIVLTPVFGFICVAARWRDVQDRKARWQLVQTQALHWFGVILAMNLVFVSDVEKIMNSDATGLMLLTVFALGTFTAGIITGAWRICLIGLLMGLEVPAIAWLEESTLLLILLLAVAIIAMVVLFYLHNSREIKRIPRSPFA
jgi:hypothetical protein